MAQRQLCAERSARGYPSIEQSSHREAADAVNRWRICIVSDLGFWVCWLLGICNGIVPTIDIYCWQLPFWKPILWLDQKLCLIDPDRQRFHEALLREWWELP